MSVTYPKRLIEVDLPIKRISAHARREKSIRHGHICTLHVWWARRPLAACRAVLCAALWPDPADALCPQEFRVAACDAMNAFPNAVRESEDVQKIFGDYMGRFLALEKKPLDPKNRKHWEVLRYLLLDFIAAFSAWEASTEPHFLETARALTQAAHEALGGEPGTRPLVVDPFAGGGAIPLEALRVGADAFASDLNPVAVLLNKVVLEYIPKYGHRLADEVRKWGQWVKEQAEKELAEFYPKDPDGATPIAYLWARTIECEGPGCGKELPLIRSLWLSKRQRKALRYCVERADSTILFSIASDVRESDLQHGTVRRGTATCPLCGYTTSRDSVQTQMTRRKHRSKLLAVVTQSLSGGKNYRLPTSDDLAVLREAQRKVNEERIGEFIPDEPLPYLRSIFNVHVYGIQTWNALFDNRQKLALATIVRIVSCLPGAIGEADNAFKEAFCTCVGLAVDRLADFNSNIARWANHRETSAATFGRQALGMVWDYCETVPVGKSTGSLSGSIDWVARVCDAVAQAQLRPGQVQQVSAVCSPLADDIASFVFTDPPYYDAIPYANLSDFFYVWLKRSIGQFHPDLFSLPETPKKGEAVQLAERNPAYAYKTRTYFEDLMRQSFCDMRRYVEPRGIGTVVFAHKDTSAWETLLSAVISAGWTITASWPLDTEMSSRLRARNSAVLASSVHLVCRPRENPDGSLRTDDVGDWRDVLAELPKRIHEWLPRLGTEGVVGADAIFACLGPALEIFSRYSRVEKASGEEVSLREYLEHVWAAVAKEALNMIFEGADATGFEEDARLTAMWLWTLSTGANGDGKEDSTVASTGYTLEYDAARKIAQGLGAHLEQLDTVVEVKGNKARLLPVSERASVLLGSESGGGPRRRKKKQAQLTLFDADDEEHGTDDWGDVTVPTLGDTTLDRVHQSMILFASGRSAALKRFLVEDGAGTDQGFWRLANALSALYPSGTDEKRWVDGVLARKKGLGF